MYSEVTFRGEAMKMSTKTVLNLSLTLLLIAAAGFLVMYFYVPALQTTGFLISFLLGIGAIIILLIMNNRKKVE
ncbi:PEP-CTERM protein-sorting domain-containing protein [Lacicoccus alkaliphilus]